MEKIIAVVLDVTGEPWYDADEDEIVLPCIIEDPETGEPAEWELGFSDGYDVAKVMEYFGVPGQTESLTIYEDRYEPNQT